MKNTGRIIIGIRLKDEDFNRVLKCQNYQVSDDAKKLFGVEEDFVDNPYFGEVIAKPSKGSFLTIVVEDFEDFDNAQYLLNKYDTYDKVLNLILCGNTRHPFLADTKDEKEWIRTEPKQKYDPHNIHYLKPYDIDFTFTFDFETNKWYYTDMNYPTMEYFLEYMEILEKDETSHVITRLRME